MLNSVVPKVKKPLLSALIVLAVAVSYCFKYNRGGQDWLTWTNRCFSESFDPSGDAKLKKWEFILTDDYFIRLRKTYKRGKEEYYSFNLRQFNNMDYLGGTDGGILRFKTMADDIIVQTYNDRHGNVDSMATELDIPVKNMSPDRLDSLNDALNYFKAKDL